MTVCAIMQPTYLPWLGYFDLMARSDVFVFLDDVQFDRRSWQSRNRILGASGEVTLSVPVRKHPRDTKLLDIGISDDHPWRAGHLASFRHAYASAPHFDEALEFLSDHLGRLAANRLADLNCGLIDDAANRLGVGARRIRSSALGCSGARSARLVEICKAVGCDSYLSPPGSADYLAEDGDFERSGIPVSFNTYEPVSYPQRRRDFTPYMSFMDALANVGWDGVRGLVGR